MSELIHSSHECGAVRKQLFATVSALALVACLASIDSARADDVERPTVWVELGGQMESMQGLSNPFVAPFMTLTPTPEPYKVDSLTDTQRPPRNAFGLEGKITFQPKGSEWTFSAGVRYGRVRDSKHIHHQSAVPPITIVTYYGNVGTQVLSLDALADTRARHDESHTILDFTVGRDVGLGVFEGVSTVSAGIRFAQFSMKSSINITARPFVGVTTPIPGYAFPSYNHYALQAQAIRSFRGVGPSLSWSASPRLIGDTERGEITVDFGINAALLFGRQKARTDHATQAYHNSFSHAYKYHTQLQVYQPQTRHSTRSRSTIVPNLGGFAGFSVQYPAAKVSLGYRADFFFGAVDAGIDVRRTKNLGFNGPFATISIGLGG